MELWKDNKFDPSATLWEGEVQLKICKKCGPLPLENFSDDGKYEKLCINCESESRRKKDIKYDTSIRRKTATEARLERQPWEKYLRSAGQKFSSLPYTRLEFREHMRNLYESWMTDNNYGKPKSLPPKTWEIEHKIPQSFFGPYVTFPLSENSAYQKLWCLENLRPFERLRNGAKNARVILPEGVEDQNVLLECTLEVFKELMKNWKD